MAAMVLSEDEALELLAFLITAARTQLDEAAEYGPLRMLTAAEVRALVDSPVFHAGVLTKAGATVHPARLARGLRRVLLERGVRIHESTHVSRFGALI